MVRNKDRRAFFFKNKSKTEKEINSVYQKILKQYSSDFGFIKNLKTSQKLWIQFRDAEMKMKFPDRPTGYYGSIQPMCWFNYMADLTKDRIKTLDTWVTGTVEGDACSGSVKAND